LKLDIAMRDIHRAEESKSNIHKNKDWNQKKWDK